MKHFDRNTWQTPRQVFNAVNGRIPMVADVAASQLNALLPVYLTEADNALTYQWRLVAKSGQYVWCNPPYSKPLPWVRKAAKQQNQQIGTVMLLFADPSPQWFITALQHVSEVWQVVNGRLSYINPVTGKAKRGNDRPSCFLIFEPGGRPASVPVITRYIDCQQLEKGVLHEIDYL